MTLDLGLSEIPLNGEEVSGTLNLWDLLLTKISDILYNICYYSFT